MSMDGPIASRTRSKLKALTSPEPTIEPLELTTEISNDNNTRIDVETLGQINPHNTNAGLRRRPRKQPAGNVSSTSSIRYRFRERFPPNNNNPISSNPRPQITRVFPIYGTHHQSNLSLSRSLASIGTTSTENQSGGGANSSRIQDTTSSSIEFPPNNSTNQAVLSNSVGLNTTDEDLQEILGEDYLSALQAQLEFDVQQLRQELQREQYEHLLQWSQDLSNTSSLDSSTTNSPPYVHQHTPYPSPTIRAVHEQEPEETMSPDVGQPFNLSPHQPGKQNQCVICYSDCNLPYKCNMCRQSIGCLKCIMQWYRSDNIRSSSCPLCRQNWIFHPHISLASSSVVNHH